MSATKADSYGVRYFDEQGAKAQLERVKVIFKGSAELPVVPLYSATPAPPVVFTPPPEVVIEGIARRH